MRHTSWWSAAVGLLAVACLGVWIPCDVAAHEGHSQSSPARSSAPTTSNSTAAPPAKNLRLDARTFKPPHGGQVTATRWHFFEVVYAPQESRVYIYSPSQTPLHARAVKGQMTLQVQSSTQSFRYPVKQATDDAGVVYLSVPVDVSRVRDGDMRVTFELDKLPFREEPKASFAQTFALSTPSLAVTVVPITAADQALVDAQRTCPVMDVGLADHGEPIKLAVGEQTLFVCCEGCVDQVRSSPGEFVQKAATLAPVVPAPPEVSFRYAGEADGQTIQRQSVCPVSGQRLGARGVPVRLALGDQAVFFCSKDCVVRQLQSGLEEMSTPPVEKGTNGQTESQLHVAWAADIDRPAIAAQRICPVTRELLGRHGVPLKVQLGRQVLFVCCEGCIASIEQHLPAYFEVPATPRR